MKRSFSKALFLCPLMAWFMIGCGSGADHPQQAQEHQPLTASMGVQGMQVSVQSQDELEIKAEGNWSEADSRTFYNKCMKVDSQNKRENSQIHIETYCSCLKDIMLENNYRPDQLNKAVKAERKEVIECLTGAIKKDE